MASPFRGCRSPGERLQDTEIRDTIRDSRPGKRSFAWCPRNSAAGLEYAALSDLAAELLGLIETNTPAEVRAGLSTSLPRMVAGSPHTLLRVLHYPPLDGGEEEGAVRAAPHEDINLITLLVAATAPGLQVCDTRER